VESVLLPMFVTQMSAPSKATAHGSVPTAKVPKCSSADGCKLKLYLAHCRIGFPTALKTVSALRVAGEVPKQCIGASASLWAA
jgi:hypothetical protein